jgi:dienelactone hydrolase
MLDPSAFDYDRDAPLDLNIVSERTQDGVSVQDVTYGSPGGGVIPAYLIFPAHQAPQAGLIVGHWGEGNREEFVAEAQILARLRLVAVCLDAPFRRPMAHEPALADIPALDLQWVVDVRRSADLLQERFHLLSGQMGYVGHSYTATLGGAVAGIERRIAAHVLMAGEGALSEFMPISTHPGLVLERETTPPDEYRAYVAALAPLDARHYIGQAAPSQLFFQFARNDEFLPPERGELYFALASEPKRIAWYDCKHAFNGQARQERASFLSERLGLARPSQEILTLLERLPAPTPLERWMAEEPAPDMT